MANRIPASMKCALTTYVDHLAKLPS